MSSPITFKLQPADVTPTEPRAHSRGQWRGPPHLAFAVVCSLPNSPNFHPTQNTVISTGAQRSERNPLLYLCSHTTTSSLCTCPFQRRTSSFLVRSHQMIVGEDHISANQFGTISCLKPLYGLGFAMRFICRFVFKNEEVHKASRIVLLLPRQVHSSTWFVRLYIRNELLNCLLDLVDARRPDPILRDCVDCHVTRPFSVPDNLDLIGEAIQG